MILLSIETQELLDRADQAIAHSRQLVSERAQLLVRIGKMAAGLDLPMKDIRPSATRP
jgi:hypothetical protein